MSDGISDSYRYFESLKRKAAEEQSAPILSDVREGAQMNAENLSKYMVKGMSRKIPAGFTYDDKRAGICKYYDKLAITIYTQEMGWTYVIDSTKTPMQPRTFESLDEVMEFLESCEYVKFEVEK